MKITEEQFWDITMGCVLGDASIPNYTDRKKRIEFTQSEDQLDYLKLKYNLVSQYLRTTDIIPVKRKDIDKKCYRFTVSPTFPTEENFIEYFYSLTRDSEGNRMIPENISEFITPLILLFWYMDDGSLTDRHESKRYRLAIGVKSYSDESIHLLRDVIKEKYDINLSFENRNFNGVKKINRIQTCNYIEINKFLLLFKEYQKFIPKNMKYKFNYSKLNMPPV
jgi:hypothetical protein